jgi:hypothetical protein
MAVHHPPGAPQFAPVVAGDGVAVAGIQIIDPEAVAAVLLA